MGLTFLDFFSGIGGFRLGMEMAGHKCLGHCEIDKFADKSYRAMHDAEESEWYANDIRGVNPGDLPEADCWCGGFPCQAFSIAGKRAGFEDMRGTLIFEIFRLAAERKPKILFLENVEGLLNHDEGRTFATILCGLWELGYNVQWQVLNSKNFGVPQNRERVLIVGYLGKRSGRKIFPIFGSNKETIKQIIGGSQAERVYDSSGLSCTLSSQGGGGGAKTGLYLCKLDKPYIDGKFTSMKGYGASIRDIGTDTAGTITSRYHKGLGANGDNAVLVRAVLTPDREEKRQNGRRIKEPGEPMFTLTAQDKHGIYISEATKQGYDTAFEGDSINLAVPGSKTRRGRVGKGVANTLDTSCNQGTLIQDRIRRLTPKECFRLQGFPDEYFYRAAKVNSDSQLYKQAGNSVTVNVIYEVARRLE